MSETQRAFGDQKKSFRQPPPVVRNDSSDRQHQKKTLLLSPSFHNEHSTIVCLGIFTCVPPLSGSNGCVLLYLPAEHAENFPLPPYIATETSKNSFQISTDEKADLCKKRCRIYPATMKYLDYGGGFWRSGTSMRRQKHAIPDEDRRHSPV